ncbi:MAG: 3-deoxy-8-phosphooctulonate synthase [Candidatus Aminicenantales bacterium]
MPIAAKEIKVNFKVKIGGKNPLFVIGGPCVIESEEHTFFMAQEIKKICQQLNLNFIFKASFDKANRSSIKSYRGPGLEKGLKILENIKSELSLPVISDIHEAWQVEKAAKVLDIIQIPAFLSRQTDLIVAAAKTQKPLNIKKGQFLSPYEVKNIIEKALSQGNDKIMITERGTCFGYHNLVVDMRSIPIMKKWGYPVIIDASHSVQRPGGQGTFSGGEAEFIPHIARAGLSVGADGLFIEVHDNPSQALSDGYNSLKLNKLHDFLASLSNLKKCLNQENFFD